MLGFRWRRDSISREKGVVVAVWDAEAGAGAEGRARFGRQGAGAGAGEMRISARRGASEDFGDDGGYNTVGMSPSTKREVFEERDAWGRAGTR
jgi:hypothetical protein